MWIWGMDSKYGSEKYIEYVRRSYLQKKIILQCCGIFIKIQKSQRAILKGHSTVDLPGKTNIKFTKIQGSKIIWIDSLNKFSNTL